MSSELAILRDKLSELQSYELPSKYHPQQLLRLGGVDDKENNHPNDDDDDANNIIHGNNAGSDEKKGGEKKNKKFESSSPPPSLTQYDPQLLQRYTAARDSYIRQRTLESFLSCLANYDASTNTIPLPDNRHGEEEAKELERRQREVVTEIQGTMTRMTEGMDDVARKWEGFCKKREELGRIVEGMEREERNRRLEGDTTSGDNDDDNKMDNNAEGSSGDNGNDQTTTMDEEEITDEDVAAQEEQLEELRQRKLRLERRLQSVRAEIVATEDECHEVKRVVNECRVRGGRRPLDWRGFRDNNDDDGGGEGGKDDGNNDDDGVEYISVTSQEAVDAEIAEMERKARELRESSAFYDEMRGLMEELGGVKILSSKQKTISKEKNGGSSAEDDGESPEKRAKLNQKKEEEAKEEGFVLTFLLLDKHILEITLSNNLIVSNARLVTPRESSAFYDEMRGLMEELGGVKILSSKQKTISKEKNGGRSAADGNDEESPEKRAKRNTNKETEKEEEGGFVLTFLLLDKHILEITLSSNLIVSNARLVTPTAKTIPDNNDPDTMNEATATLLETMHSISLTNVSFSKIMSQTPSSKVTIPPLDDLVEWSQSLDASSSASSNATSSSPQGIRFVIVETMARLRTLEARVEELAALRENYATQLYDVAGDAREQEAVCTINEGIVVAVRLGADCPLLPGSCYVSELFGVGGWDEGQLEELKKAVERRRCR
eukprot:CAMPEP_0183744868 /NCGR_PEP_ID=MMETSP0737-20130205/65950_1 /TAXON_ID=385413 /ORGANISM="Thalassiosira miniscula, Strain CCMP1093" /LENGTH=719 /DNA_ID=CAMNT_0025980521 /DNA_START=79 /DNA_END=2235 /DNA_ORIENTATION=-